MLLGFFRKHQRVIFSVVAGVVMVSFSFFGTYSVMSGPKQTEGAVVRTLPNGTKVTAREWERLVAFLKSSRATAFLLRDPLQANLINDGVIENDLMAAGATPWLAKGLEAELAEKEARERLMPLYVHSGADYMSTQKVWDRIAPQLAMEWNGWCASQGAPAAERWQQRARLFMAQRMLPPEWLRAMLHREEQMNPKLAPDGRLAHIDLALFGYHSLEEWFGKPFIEEAASWILYGAMYAEQMGYHVSLEMARKELIAQAHQAFALAKGDPRLEGVDFQTFLHHQVAQWGGDEELAARLWQRVLLFRKLLTSRSEVAAGAALPYELFGEFAQQNWHVKRYELAPEFRTHSPEELARLSAYLKAIEAKDPQLMGSRYRVEIAATTVQEIEAQIPLQQLRAHQGNLDLTSKTVAERRQLDSQAREELLRSHPEWIAERLAKAKTEEREMLLAQCDLPSKLPGLTQNELREILDDATPSQLTGDAEHYFSIRVIERSEPQMLTYAQVKELGLLKEVEPATDTIHPLKQQIDAAYAALSSGAPEEQYIRRDNSFDQQFKLVVREDHLARSSRPEPIILALQAGQWSSLQPDLRFYHCIALTEGPALERGRQERQLIDQASKREITEQLAGAVVRGDATWEVR